ncbi:hypothetical protein [Thiomonas sp. FB-Cd]|uniref:hypothetical protein n=1 Tax=Thiomonas sp. FB-Cd TaxID=1158292 RepID=UPI0004DF8D84|nr:hypothetical protein [Thiomonas sp. FB-Cd]
MDDSTTKNQDQEALDRRREQNRAAQQRRRQRLGMGGKIQMDLFLSPNAVQILDSLASELGVERQSVVELVLQWYADARVKRRAAITR